MTLLAPDPALVARTGGVVLAAGSGARFGRPKQFERIGGVRLVDRAISLIEPWCSTVVVVLPQDHQWDGSASVTAVAGAKTRVGSVTCGLSALPDELEFLIVHDSIRPLATSRSVAAVLAAVVDGAAGSLPVWETPDTVKRLVGDRFEHLGREGIVIGNGPFAFRADILRSAIAAAGTSITEESLAVEAAGGKMVPVPGDRWSVHIVEPRDLLLAERLIDIIDVDARGHR